MDAPYTVLARRFRPQTFAEVVGQERIAQTLRNAILEGRVAHAYLFTGARGVGKTSMARIFAKALNCPNAKDAVPCNQCEVCRGISLGQDVDVSEIDGASNRGIDDIRSLRANVNVRSMRSRYKIYIIDEVHMLTKEAFNALLKTLEEPPPSVKFLFCTTEPNKLPDTILSRCQRFDFGTIETSNIVRRLEQLAEAEGVQVDADALDLVARRAAGSMRDSQSLFDQLLAFGSDRIGAADVHRLLGTAPDERLIALVEALAERRRDVALQLFGTALTEGVQLDALMDQFVSYFRDLMVTACGTTDVPLLSVGEENRAAVQRQAERWGLHTVVAAMQILAEAKARMQRVTHGRALAELALVRISLLEDLDRLDDILGQLKGGAPVAGNGQPAPRRTAPASPPARTPAPSPPPPQKKSPEVVRDTAPPVEPVNSGESVTPPAQGVARPAVEFQPGNESALLAQLLANLNDITRDHLRRASALAISGPNHLEISFPESYDFSRRYCERPEVLGRLESVTERLTGKPVSVRFRVIPGEPEAAPPKPGKRGTDRGQSETPDDPFVQQAMTIFGATSWRVQEVPTTTDAPAQDED